MARYYDPRMNEGNMPTPIADSIRAGSDYLVLRFASDEDWQDLMDLMEAVAVGAAAVETSPVSLNEKMRWSTAVQVARRIAEDRIKRAEQPNVQTTKPGKDDSRITS